MQELIDFLDRTKNVRCAKCERSKFKPLEYVPTMIHDNNNYTSLRKFQCTNCNNINILDEYLYITKKGSSPELFGIGGYVTNDIQVVINIYRVEGKRSLLKVDNIEILTYILDWFKENINKDNQELYKRVIEKLLLDNKHLVMLEIKQDNV